MVKFLSVIPLNFAEQLICEVLELGGVQFLPESIFPDLDLALQRVDLTLEQSVLVIPVNQLHLHQLFQQIIPLVEIIHKHSQNFIFDLVIMT